MSIGKKEYMEKNFLFLSIAFLSVIVVAGCETSEDEVTQQETIHLIYDFTPEAGSVGTEVMIYGMHFSEEPAENIVKFRDMEAEVIDASIDKLKVRVPAKARTGKISITVRGTTSISTEDFVVK